MSAECNAPKRPANHPGSGGAEAAPRRELPVPSAPAKKGASQSEHMTPCQVARMLNAHVSTIYRLILTGKIPARRIGGRRFVVRRDDAERFCEGEPVVPFKPVEWNRHDADDATK